MTARMHIAYVEALAISRSIARRLPTERLPLTDALGRVAASNLTAPFALPGFVNSAMDGYAIRGADVAMHGEKAFRVSGQILAGQSPPKAIGKDEAVAIMTGAPLPAGADTVVIREVARVDGQTVWLPSSVSAGANVRQADDDCAAGASILVAGEVLGAPRLALLAAFGLETVEVSRRPRVAVLVTGDELVAAGGALGPGLRYDSNGTLLSMLARSAGADVVRCEHCADDPDALRGAIGRLSQEADVLLTSGGVSAGVADHLPDVIGTLGQVHFWKARIKPGMPVLCASIGTCLVFALPGNPVSSGITFQVLARPALDTLQGRVTPHGLIARARLSAAWRKTHARMEFLRVMLQSNANGELLATPLIHQGSGALSRLADAQAVAILPEGERDYAVGDVVDIEGIAVPFAAA